MADGLRRAYRLRRDETVADGLRRIAAGRAAKALERLRGVEPGADGYAEAVHGARKDMKKLRAVVRLLREPLGEEAYRRENRAFRDAGRALSASRDAQVRLEMLDALAERREDLPSDALALWRSELERELRESEDVEARLGEATEPIEAGAARIQSWKLSGDSWALLEAGLTRAYRDGRRAMRRARRGGDAQDFHQWRKRAKDLWYQLEIVRDAWPPVLGETAEEAHRLSELLGDHHDLFLLDEDLGRRVIEARRAATLRAAISARQEELAGGAFELGARLYAERPKAYRRRLRAYWHAWRSG